MSIKQIVRKLEKAAILMELWGDNTFKIRAYQKAARVMRELTDEDLGPLITDKKLMDHKGIGKNLFSHIKEIYEKGTFDELERLISKVPGGLVEMLEIPGLGPKKIQAIYKDLGITDIDSLKKASLEGKLSTIRGFKDKTIKNILKGIENFDRNFGLIYYHHAFNEAMMIKDYIHSMTSNPVYIAGSLRRFKELVHDIDLVTYNTEPDLVCKALEEAPFTLDITQKGHTKLSFVTKNNIQCDIRIVQKDELYSALHYLTGSKEHNTRMRAIAKEHGLKLNEYGIFTVDDLRLSIQSEADIFRHLGINQYIPAVLREDMGELEAAKCNKLPSLIELKDIKGIFHCHTNFSDGDLNLERLVEIASEMNFQYIGISDHSVSAYYASGLTIPQVHEQWRIIDNINRSQTKMKILKGIESDISPDGELDYPEHVLEGFDFIIGSVHSGFNMNKNTMTQRICKAISNPYLDILGHPTGRLLKKRDPYKVDMIELIKTAVKYKKYIEINAHPMRLDLDWVHLKKGIKMGLKSVISLDIHSYEDFSYLPLGLKVAQKAWATVRDILNTQDCDDFVRPKYL